MTNHARLSPFGPTGQCVVTARRDWERIGHGIMEGIDAEKALIIPYHKPLAAMSGW